MAEPKTIVIPYQCTFARCGCMWWTIPKTVLNKLSCLNCGLLLVAATENDVTDEDVRLIYSEESNFEPQRFSKRAQQQIDDANEHSSDLPGHDNRDHGGEFEFGE